MNTWRQFVRFIFVSGLNTLVGYSLYALFIFINVDYSLAMLFATVIGVLFNFKTTGKFVFNNKKNGVLFKFAAVYIFIYFFNLGAIQIVRLMISSLYIAGLVVMVPAAIITFVLNKLFVFREIYEAS